MPPHPLRPSPPFARLAPSALTGLAFAVYAAYFLILVRYAVALFQFPFDYDRGEGFELNSALLFSRGEWPYKDNEVYPFFASAYPPLYHLIVAPLVAVFGPQYWTGRLVSFLATLAAAGAIAWAVRRGSGNGTIAALSGLTFLASNYVYHIGPLFRQHMTMAAFETLAVVALAASGPGRGLRLSRGEGLGLVFLLAAGFTKPLAYATVAACFLFLVIRSPRRGLALGAAFGAAAAGLMLLMEWATGGHWWLNVVLANVNEFVPGQAAGLYRQWYQLHAILIWLAGGWAAYQALHRLRWTPQPAPAASHPSIYSIWLLFTVANGATAGKWGAGESYFVTAIAAVCIGSGLALGDLARASAGWPRPLALAVALAIPALYLAQAARLVHLPTTGRVFGVVARSLGIESDSGYYDSQGYTQLGRPPNAIDIAQGMKIAAFVKASPGPILSEEAAFPLMAGKDVVTDPSHLLNLYENGQYDPSSLIGMIQAQAFGGVVLNAQFYPLPVLQAIGQAYAPAGDVNMNGFTYRLLRPRGP